jgi:hypothetical protein
MEHEAELLATIRLQQAGMAASDSPFYETLCDGLAVDTQRDGPAAAVLAPFAAAPFEAAYVLRLLGGLHRLVLSGQAPTLARHYPSTDGDGDADAAIAAIRALLADPPAAVLGALQRPPQTNEVGRSVALASGFLLLAQELGLPLRLREIGSSGGLNLRADSYWYEQDGQGWGNEASTVRFVDLWRDGRPPFAHGFDVADRRGCDRDPIDATSRGGGLTLLSYVWPEPPERFRRARAALTQAGETPVVIDRADADAWVGAQLVAPQPGTALVFFHSVVWQYFDEATRAAVRDQLDRAGRAATTETPLAWLRLEPHPATYVPAELRLTVWDGRGTGPHERLLATTGFHGGPITWLADPRREPV